MKYLLLAVALASTGTAQTKAPVFLDSRTDYNVSGAFAIADFNGDGYPDIAASDSSDTIVIYLNDGTGRFNKFASIAGSPANYLVAGDFNNDGIPDIAFLTYDTVGIVLGAGDGTLRNYYTYSGVNAYNSDVKAVDMNLDGNLDVVVNNAIIFGKGDGTLGASTATGCSGSFDVKDMNGDGYPDLVCSTESNNVSEVHVVFNYGVGSVQSGPSAPMPNGSPNSIALGDVDGNGTNDVVAVNNDDLVVFLNNGNGNLTQTNVYQLTLPSYDVKLADVNGDGHLDAMFSQDSTSSVHPAQNLLIWTGNGNGGFSKSAAYATAGADSRIVLSDLRKNGYLDIVAGTTNSFTPLFNQKNNTFNDGLYTKVTSTRLGSAVSADFNHDGIPDLAVSVLTDVSSPTPSNHQLSGAYIFLGTGKAASPFSPAQRLFVPPNVAALATGDFNGDGNPDLAFLTGQELVIYLGSAAGTFTAGPTYPSSARALTVGDFNGDGKVDIATSGVYLFTGNGDGTFVSSFLFVAAGPELVSADLNRDGNLDLIATLNNSDDFEVALGKGNGRFSTPVVYQQSSQSIVVGDFNGDGFPDIALLSGYVIAIWNNTPGTPGLFVRGNTISVSNSGLPINLVAGDFNGDGILDLATASIDVDVFTGAGAETFNSALAYGGANYPNFLVSGNVLVNATGLPSIIAVGNNSAISFFNNETK